LARASSYARYHNPRHTEKCWRQDADNSRTFNDCRGQRERVLDVSRTLDQWLPKVGRYAMDGILLAGFSRLHLPRGAWSRFLRQTIKSALVILQRQNKRQNERGQGVSWLTFASISFRHHLVLVKCQQTQT